jgi:hypothetical protein
MELILIFVILIMVSAILLAAATNNLYPQNNELQNIGNSSSSSHRPSGPRALTNASRGPTNAPRGRTNASRGPTNSSSHRPPVPVPRVHTNSSSHRPPVPRGPTNTIPGYAGSWKEKLDKWKNGEDLPDFRREKSGIRYLPNPIYLDKPNLGQYIDENKKDFEDFPNVEYNKGKKNFEYNIYSPNPKDVWIEKLNEKIGEPAIILSSVGKNLLIIPPIEKEDGTNIEKNFTNIYYFSKRASNEVQKKVWKLVAETIEKIIQKSKDIPSEFKKNLGNKKKLEVNTEGHGVSYLHIRIKPKF